MALGPGGSGILGIPIKCIEFQQNALCTIAISSGLRPSIMQCSPSTLAFQSTSCPVHANASFILFMEGHLLEWQYDWSISWNALEILKFQQFVKDILVAFD